MSTSRVSLDAMVDDFIALNRASRLPRPASIPQARVKSTFINEEKRNTSLVRQRERADQLLSTIMQTKALFRKQKIVEALRPDMLRLQATALAQRLFAEVARNPESYTKLSQSETAALGQSATPATVRPAHPKAALRLAAIQAMNQALAPRAAALTSAVTKLEDFREKKELQNESLEIRLQELGYDKVEATQLAQRLQKTRLADYITSGTINSKRGLESVLDSAATSKKVGITR